MTPHATKGRGGRLYRYYLSTQDAKQGSGASVIKMLPAGEIEEAVMVQIRAILRSAEVVTQVWRAIENQRDNNAATESMTEIQVAVALSRIDEIWEQLFPLEQYRIVQLLVESVIVSPNELRVNLYPNGVENLALDVLQNPLSENHNKAAKQQETLA